MPGWRDRLFGPKTLPLAPAGQHGLPPELDGYPPFSPLHPGSGPDFPLDHARANFEQLMAELPTRVATATSVLAAHGCDPRPGLAGEDPRAFLDALWRWSREAWPKWPQPWKDRYEGWRGSDRAGPDLALSFFVDVGLVLGEIVRALRPEYVWELNTDRRDREMTYYRQLELMVYAPDPKLLPKRFDFDPVGLVVHEASGRGLTVTNALEDAVASFVLGGFEASWHLRNGIVPESPDWVTWLARRGPPHPFADA